VLCHVGPPRVFQIGQQWLAHVIRAYMSKFALWRLLLASIASPLVVSVVFLLLQGVMRLLLGASFRFTVLAPYAVACPVICTLYRIALPNADHGATGAVTCVIGHLLHGRQN
jgi:hypothetical protein